MTCRICKYDPGAKYNVNLLSSNNIRKWAAHHSDTADYTFQNGAEAWFHDALPSVSAHDLESCDFVFVSVFFTYMFIFKPSLVRKASRELQNQIGWFWDRYPERLIFSHTHPGACIPETRNSYRLLVDMDLSCIDSLRPVMVPYVIPDVQPPSYDERKVLLFFMGHVPKTSIDRKSVRRRLLLALAGLNDVEMKPSTNLPGSRYIKHEYYIKAMRRSVFCLAPRGDTRSSKRVFESISHGCIPVIISSGICLPYSRQIDWNRAAVHFDEQDTLHDPMMVIQTLRNMTARHVESYRSYLKSIVHMFVWKKGVTNGPIEAIRRDICNASFYGQNSCSRSA